MSILPYLADHKNITLTFQSLTGILNSHVYVMVNNLDCFRYWLAFIEANGKHIYYIYLEKSFHYLKRVVWLRHVSKLFIERNYDRINCTFRVISLLNYYNRYFQFVFNLNNCPVQLNNFMLKVVMANYNTIVQINNYIFVNVCNVR